jgi:hypothetical protein
MANVDLRPLSLGEILDRTFSLYRANFILFVGISAIPQLLVLCANLAQSAMATIPNPGRVVIAHRAQAPPSSGLIGLAVVGALIGIVVFLIAYLFAQGGTVYAVSEIYLGRATTIGGALRRMRGQVGSLFGVTLLNGLVIGIATLALIIPGIYMACRLITCIPAALLENLGPRDSLERSFRLTQGSAGRSFVIYLLYFFLLYSATLLCVLPFTLAIAMSVRDPAMLRVWMIGSQLWSFVATVLVTPFFTIATAVFYYDLRVRKEAFDLQLMMAPGDGASPGTASVPSMFS